MRLNLLGPLELVMNGQAASVGPPKQRGLLAINADRVVPVDLLSERLWAGKPPVSGQASLQVYVSNLRRCLESGRSSRVSPTVTG
ncbi:winged helix-turn-helix domain-containing protein [Nonomuraea sp. MTCD27]|uniref:AfsR/SARP family transcriptional regulator n=1 Tax=Nonomuraea sp. MTCD27 TaxID=1676747 RepID=UPI0035C07FC2